MRCKKCDRLLSLEDHFCQRCGQISPLKEQKNKISALRERQRNLLNEKTRSPLFVIIAVLFSLMTLSRIANFLYSDYTALLDGTFMGIAAVSMWICYAISDNQKLAKALRRASIHDAFVRVVFTILILIISIAMVGLAIVLFVGAGVIAINTGWNIGKDIPLLLVSVGIFVLIFGGIALVLIALVRMAYAARRKYFVSLGEFAAGGVYDAESAPFSSSLIFGISCLGFSLLSVISSVLITILSIDLTNGVYNLVDFVSKLGIDISQYINPYISPDGVVDWFALFGVDGFISIGDLGILDGVAQYIGSYISYFTSIITVAVVVASVALVANGVYFILSAVWMRSVHKDAVALRAEIDRECALRIEIEKSIKAELLNENAECEDAEPEDVEDSSSIAGELAPVETQEENHAEKAQAEAAEENPEKVQAEAAEEAQEE